MTRKERAHAEGASQAGTKLQRALLAWYDRAKRDLPWRKTTDPYAVWLSEIMLQQTRVETVIPYYERFVTRWPTVHALAEAPLDDVLAMWSGLGYYRRARMLHAGARAVADAGAFPDNVQGLRAIPGVGAYTAGAVASIAFGRKAALVDGNVARVIARVFAIEEDVRASKGLARVWSVAEALVPEARAGDFNQALMELGATVCTPREPRCLLCPVRDLCAARARGTERELPRMKAKAKPKAVQRLAVVATDAKGRVLLARRAEGGTFAGMWEPPSIDRDGEGDARALGLALSGVEPCGRVVHVLSHRRLEIDVVRARIDRAPKKRAPRDYDAWELVDPDAFGGRGVTTMAKKILRAAHVSLACPA